MKKSNVITMGRRAGDGREAHPQAAVNHDVLGWLIYRPDTEEYLVSHKASIGHAVTGYAKNPEYAYCFGTERLAFRYSTFIDKPTEIVKLFDFGDKLVVCF